MKAIIVADEFTTECFVPEIDFYEMGADEDIEKVIEEIKPEFFFMESLWSGKDNAWGGVLHGPRVDILNKIIQSCRKHSIPTVFWNKEDPVSFDTFAGFSGLFDYVFTTCQDTVKKYTDGYGFSHDKVSCLPFAAQVKLHNPIQSAIHSDRTMRGCYAGTYWLGAHQKRAAQLNFMFDAAAPNLDIYDRNYHHNSPDRKFPKKYRKYVIGHLSNEEKMRAHGSYLYFINANIVQDSSTMMSRRVFELLATGTPILSPFYQANFVLDGAIIEANDTNEAERKISSLQLNKQLWEHQTLHGCRVVLSRHTYSHRMQQILNTLGLVDSKVEERVKTLREIPKLSMGQIKNKISKMIGDWND